MRIGEPHAFGGNLVDAWRRDPGCFVIAAGITVAHIVGQNEDDVRAIVRCLVAGNKGNEKESRRNMHREADTR